MSQNASSLAPVPPPKGAPATLEGVSSFRVHTAALSRPAGLLRTADPNMVLITDAEGGVVVYPPSDKLAILAAERAKRTKASANAKSPIHNDDAS